MAPQPTFLADLERDPEAAWKGFVEESTDMVLAVLGYYLPDPDLRMDAYLFAMEAFRADGFRRLKKYVERERTGDAPFVAWLKFVTRNLALDFIRHHKGRRSLPKVVEDADAVDQAIFRCLYWDRTTHAEALEEVAARLRPDITLREVAERADAMAAALANSGHPLAWGASRAAARALSFDDPDAPLGLEADATRGAADAGFAVPEAPDVALEQERARRDVERLIADLPAEERLLLKLRYEDGLRAEEIARIIGAPTPKAVYNRLARLIERLRVEAAEAEAGP